MIVAATGQVPVTQAMVATSSYFTYRLALGNN
jgi:hypothetical protein